MSRRRYRFTQCFPAFLQSFPRFHQILQRNRRTLPDILSTLSDSIHHIAFEKSPEGCLQRECPQCDNAHKRNAYRKEEVPNSNRFRLLPQPLKCRRKRNHTFVFDQPKYSTPRKTTSPQWTLRAFLTHSYARSKSTTSMLFPSRSFFLSMSFGRAVSGQLPISLQNACSSSISVSNPAIR